MPPRDQTRAGPGAAPSRARDLATASACILAGLGFGAAVWLRRGAEPAQQYLAGYLVELSLSVDNVFVFALVFEEFRVEPARRRRLLFWGIAGAIIMRSAPSSSSPGSASRRGAPAGPPACRRVPGSGSWSGTSRPRWRP
jgi:hypothetical protein